MLKKRNIPLTHEISTVLYNKQGRKLKKPTWLNLNQPELRFKETRGKERRKVVTTSSDKNVSCP